jgi:CRP-like cAMP-binding protein
MFLLDRDDVLYRLPNTKFEQMLRDPTRHRFLRFAGTRVRMTDVILELVDRDAIRVVLTTFSFLTFDNEGYFDPSAFDRHQRARAELAFASLAAEPECSSTVVDAASRFVAQGGRWAPSRALARLIEKVALGRVQCSRL